MLLAGSTLAGVQKTTINVFNSPIVDFENKTKSCCLDKFLDSLLSFTAGSHEA
jgi:hypothetical protein